MIKSKLMIGIGILLLVVVVYILKEFPMSKSYEDLKKYAYRTIVLDNGMQVNYESLNEGADQTILFIHGGGESINSWRKQLAYFSKDNHVVALDMPGHGLTDPFEDKVYTVDKEADFIKNVVDKLGLEDIIIVAHSMGGQFATEYVMANTENVRGLVLEASAGYMAPDMDVEIERQMLEQLKSPLAQIMRYKSNYKDFSSGYMSYFYSRNWDYESRMKELYELGLYKKNRGSFFDLVLHATSQIKDFTAEDLSPIQIPVLLIWGDKDTVATPVTSDYFLRDLPNARRVMVTGVGHLFHNEQNELFNKEVETYINDLLESL